MAIKDRTALKSYFVKNAIPTEGNFADLIDSQLNQAQDGVFKLEGEPFSVVAAPGDQKRVLRLYANYPAANPDWLISLNPAQTPANPATARAGFGVTDGAGNPRLFLDAATGRLGVGTNNPQHALDVTGAARANGFHGRYDLVLNDYRTVNPASNVCLHSPPGDRDTWIYRDTADAGSNWGIYHRQINAEVAGLPANAIGFIGGGSSKLQAYVNLGDGSGFFAGGLSVQGAVDASATANTWGGWLEAIRFSRPEHSAITHPGGKLLFGLHSDRNFYFADTNAGRYVMSISGATGNVAIGYGRLDASGGVMANNIGIGTATHGAVPYQYETIQMNPTHNLRLYYGTTERFIFHNAGVFQASSFRGTAANWDTIGADGTVMVDNVNYKSMMIVGSNQNQGKARWVRLWDNLTVHGNVALDGEVEAQGAWLKVKGAGDERTYLGGDGAGNDVQVGSTKAGVMLLAAWNWANGWMDVGGRNWLGHSDLRSKEHIEPVHGALARLLRLRCVSFDWKGEEPETRKVKNLGFIAQEVREAVPEAVVELRGGSLSIAYNAITALLVEAIKEQQQQIDGLRAVLKSAPAPQSKGQ